MGRPLPRMCPFLNPHVAHVHRRIVPSTHTGPPQLSQGWMPHEDEHETQGVEAQ